MKQAIMVAGLALIGGCATTATPQQAVGQLDMRSPKYETQECRNAREIALTYDDNVAGRMGLGLGLGILLGPFGLPLALAADMSQADKGNAVVGELKKHCEGPLPSAVNGSKTDLQIRTEMLEDLRSKGLLTEDEFNAKRKQLLDIPLTSTSG